MVEFKVLKYKHVTQSNKLLREGTDEDQANFVASLVKTWDYVDVETGELIPVGEVDELSVEQFNQVMQAFQEAVIGQIVPNENAAP